MTRVGFVVAWLIATGLATAFAWQVVGAANEQVSDAPLTPLIAITTATAPTDTPAQVSTTSTLSDALDPHVSTAPTSVPEPTSTTTTSPGDTTPTSVPDSTTTTVVPNVGATTAVSQGGTVSVRGSEPSVELVAVVANPGWSYEVSTDDGTRVEVRFEHHRGDIIRVRSEWTGGLLVADIDD